MRAWIVAFVAALLLTGCVADRSAVLARSEREIDAGRLARAERLLRGEHAAAERRAAIGDARAYADELEFIRRLRAEYTLTADALLTKLRPSIPDVTSADLERWRQAGVLQYREFDGRILYFEREPSNLFRFCDEARQRRLPIVGRAGWSFDAGDEAAQLVALSTDASDALFWPVHHRVRYSLRVNADHPLLKPGAEVRCWLPYPQEYRQQRDVHLISADPEPVHLAPNGTPQRSIYFEQTLGDPPAPPGFTVEFEYTSSAYVPHLDPAAVRPYDTASDVYRTYTAERWPHIVFSPEICQVVAEAVGHETNPLLKARRLFDWCSDHIRYAAEQEYGTIRCLSDKGLRTRCGDCGVQAMVYITLCRAAGIPARWQSGWATRPNDWNMHDWAEFYVEPWGWLPVDASYGVQESDEPRVREFYCGSTDPYRLIVNLDYGQPFDPSKTSLRSEPTDFQRGEIEIDGQNLYFGEWTWDFDVDTQPLARTFAALPEAVDAVLPPALTKGKVCGAVVEIGQRSASGWQTWRKAYGYRETQPAPVPMSLDAIFDLASMTKPIAAGTCLMRLIERGEVSLDEPVAHVLPEFDTDAKRGVTIRNLVTHTSGMPAYVGAAERNALVAAHGWPCAAELRAAIRNLALESAPGERVRYSCLNAILCAEIVERVTHEPLDQLAAREVFGPLGMNDTAFAVPAADLGRCVPTTPSEPPRTQTGFIRGVVHDPLAAQQGGVSGNAGLFSTAADVGRFAQMLLDGGTLNGAQILKSESVAELWRVQNPGVNNAKGQPAPRGVLWEIYPADDGRPAAVGHTGYTGTAMRLYPEHGVYVVLFANRVHPDDTGDVEAVRAVTWRTVEAVLGLTAAPAASGSNGSRGGSTVAAH